MGLCLSRNLQAQLLTPEELDPYEHQTGQIDYDSVVSSIKVAS